MLESGQVSPSSWYLFQDLNKDAHRLQRYQEYFIQREIIVQVRKEYIVRNGSGPYEYYYCLGFAFMEFKRSMCLLLRGRSMGLSILIDRLSYVIVSSPAVYLIFIISLHSYNMASRSSFLKVPLGTPFCLIVRDCLSQIVNQPHPVPEHKWSIALNDLSSMVVRGRWSVFYYSEWGACVTSFRGGTELLIGD